MAETNEQKPYSGIVADNDEYFHKPGGDRIWNECWAFEFVDVDADIKSVVRLGFYPNERKSNIWFYVVTGGKTYWFRSEDIPLDACHGRHIRTDSFELSFDLHEPHKKWDINAAGTCQVGSTSSDVLFGADSTAHVEMDITFSDPLHPPCSFPELMQANEEHYDHGGRYRGTITIGDKEIKVDTVGFRDHSWNDARDWTPQSKGYIYAGLQFENGNRVNLVGNADWDGNMHEVLGYCVDETGIKPIDDIAVSYDDGYTRKERAVKWTTESPPDHIQFELLVAGEEQIVDCYPTDHVPIGYEDRNNVLTDFSVPREKAVVNRLTVEAEWDSLRGSGWWGAPHRVDRF